MPYTRVNDPEKLRRLLAAVLMLTADVQLQELLGHFVAEATALVEADFGALGVLDDSGTGLERFLTVGLSAEEERAIGPRPTGRGVLGHLITDPRPLRLRDLADDPHRFGFPPHHPAMTSFLGVPVRVRDDIYGNLYLTNKIGAPEFSDEDEALAEALAMAAGIAIQNHRLYERARVASMLDDRDRIARDLHDRVIQRIFAVGMSLQGATRTGDLAQMTGRVQQAVNELDDTIAEIRTTIFELGSAPLPGTLRQSLLDLVDELAPTLGSRPRVTFSGTVESSVPETVAEHLLAVLREGLTNASKHAPGSRVAVSLRVDERVTLEVIDDGDGFDPAALSGGLGLGNLRHRAEKLGGSFVVEEAAGGGTRLEWSVPSEDGPACA